MLNASMSAVKPPRSIVLCKNAYKVVHKDEKDNSAAEGRCCQILQARQTVYKNIYKMVQYRPPGLLSRVKMYAEWGSKTPQVNNPLRKWHKMVSSRAADKGSLGYDA